MIRWIVDHFNEAKRRIYSSYHLRRTIHGIKNYVHGKPEIIERSKFVLGSNCHINTSAYINASNGIVLGDDVTLSANCCLVSTGIDYKSWVCGKRSHISGGCNNWKPCLDWCQCNYPARSVYFR